MAMDDDGVAAMPAGEQAQPNGRVFRCDAGWKGCDEMPMEVRRQLQDVDVGDVVEFIVYDPSSKEDVPPFARMLGHRVVSTVEQGDGALVISVERAR